MMPSLPSSGAGLDCAPTDPSRTMPSRQEVANVLLAQLLVERGLVAAPEQILQVHNKGKSSVQMPDVLLDFQGLRLVIEAEWSSTPSAAKRAYEKAQGRLSDGVAHIGVAVVYPARLRQLALKAQKEGLASATLQFAILTEASELTRDLFVGATVPDFDGGGVDDLSAALRRSYEQLAQDTTLENAVVRMQDAISEFLGGLRSQPATIERMGLALGVREKGQMGAQKRQATARIAGLILVNAMIFQEVLAQTQTRVSPLRRFASDADIVKNLREHWRLILDEINYWPIFDTAFHVLDSLTANDDMRRAVQEMADTALWVVGRRAALRHDLAGRIFHRLLAEAKHLGAFYTSIPAATLLLKLSLPQSDRLDWSDLEAVKGLAVADFACGTGTLLMAAADSLLDNYVWSCGERGVVPQINQFQAAVVEKVLYGFDVLPSAIHLTASTLSLRVPDTAIQCDQSGLYEPWG
ncbi:MAG: hypothetical protein HYS12_06405 [Planctomycetes bacterium]|nr:hypothetical protein [Planctomycetota bacterium]